VSPTVAQLAALAPTCNATALAPALSAAAQEREINTPQRLAHWLGQLSVESGGFSRLTENLNYSAERLMQVWPSRFQTLAAAENCAHNPEALAIRVYSGRMGNVTATDAVKFVGRGLIQLTGRAAYRMYGAKLGLDLINRPDLAAAPATAARVAAAYWSDHGCNVLADEDNIEAITRAINGGLTGLEARKAAVAKATAILGVPAATHAAS
jgi:putative chitinase